MRNNIKKSWRKIDNYRRCRRNQPQKEQLEGAKENYPKPQRMNTRMRQTDVSDINQKQVPHKFRKEQETPHPDNYLREKHNSTVYMNLPNSIQNKVCGRCGLVGHIKKQCREEVYCKFCKNSSHSIRACRTYANFLRMDPVNIKSEEHSRKANDRRY